MVLVWAMTARESATPDGDAGVCVEHRVCTYIRKCHIGGCMDRDVYRSARGERRRECIAVTSSRRTRVHQAYTHASSRGRVCVARAPHGNDESSTLEHLASCSFLSTFHRALSLTRRLPVTDPGSFSLSLSTPSCSRSTPFRLRRSTLVFVTMCIRFTRGTQKLVGRGYVMISRLFTRSRRSFSFSLSLPLYVRPCSAFH